MLQIHLLGQPRFAVDGQPFKFSAPPKALALLAYLLLHPQGPIARDSLAFLLWPDETEDDARSKLRYHLNYLKNTLPPTPTEQPWFIADTESVQWNAAAPVSFDVAEFERCAARPDARARIVELYGGSLLENLYDDWLFAPRERLRNLYIDSLNALLLESRSRRDFSKALAYAQRILAIDPWREDTLCQLMMVRYASGDRAGALREYDSFAKRLREEMDVAPMPDTTAVRDAIARNAPVAEAEAPPLRPAFEERPPAPLLPLVGRDHEVDQLRAMWARAARDHGGAVLISGEAGIGKSRLAAELALIVGAQGGRVLVGATLHPESVPYQPIADALRSAGPLLVTAEVQSIWLAAVAQIVPEIRMRRPDLPSLSSVEADRERLRLFESIAACLGSLGASRPVLLILEDLHWAGVATISALESLARRAATQPLLIIGTYRTEEARPGQPLRDLRRRLQREGFTGHIGLARLTESAVSDLFSRMPELAARGAAAAGAAYVESEGNPFFLSEVVRDMLESATIPAAPRGLSETIRARTSRLSERARFVAQAASVVGSAFDIDTVNEISGWPESETLAAVDELVEHHLVRETGRRAAFDYAFAHHLVQAAIYDSIEAQARAHWHRRAARAIQSLDADAGRSAAAVVARHFDSAGDGREAAQQYLIAARNAHAVFAEDEALAHAARGLELSSDTALNFELLALQESLYHRLGRRSEQSTVLDRLERIARDSEDAGRLCDVLNRRVAFHRILGEREQELEQIEALGKSARAEAHWRARASLARGTYAIRSGDMDEARRRLTEASADAAACGDVAVETESLCELAYIGTLQGRTADGEAAMAKARAAAEASGNQALLAHALYSASSAALLREDFVQTQDYAQRALVLCRSIGDREGEADCCVRLAVAAARRLQVDAANEWYGKARSLYAELGKRRGQAAVALNSGVLNFMVGLLDESIAACAEAEHIFSEIDDSLGVALSTLNMGMAKYSLGEYAEAKRFSQKAVELSHKAGSKRYEASALGNLGAVERELGEMNESIEHLRASLKLRDQAGGGPDGAQDLAELAITYARVGDKLRAREIADQLMALDESSFETASTPQVVPWAAVLAYRAAGQSERAEKAADRWRTLVARRLAVMPERVRAAYQRLRCNQDPTV